MESAGPGCTWARTSGCRLCLRVPTTTLTLTRLVLSGHPTHGAQRVANELHLQGINVGVSGVRGADPTTLD